MLSFAERLNRAIGEFAEYERRDGVGTRATRNGVMYDVLPDGRLKMVSDNPNGMTYEYDVATGKRCRVSQAGEYLGEWF